MRVIGGEFRSRRIKSVPGLAVRPTTDRLRETLFNVLASRIEGAVFVDAYAGSGAVGIEALSRGAARAIFVEKSAAAVRVIRENLASLELNERALVVQGAVLETLPRHQGDIVFLDPPYERGSEYGPALTMLAEAPLVIAQHDRRTRLDEDYGNLRRTREIRQGDNVLSFYSTAQDSR
ncbi:MAG: 16S rRNA (guanine(966)-N(2))-methyltransferase RsmD [Bryobacteraceae bacterium]